MLQGPQPAPLEPQWQQCGLACALLNCWLDLPGSQTPVWKLLQQLHLCLRRPEGLSVGAVAAVHPDRMATSLLNVQHRHLEPCALQEKWQREPCKIPCNSLAVLLTKENAVGVSCRLLWLWLWNGACKAEPTVSTPATPAPTGCCCQQTSKLVVLSNTYRLSPPKSWQAVVGVFASAASR